jgi:hypothetical protein
MATKKKKFKTVADSIHGRGGGLGGPDVEEEDDMVLHCFEYNKLARLVENMRKLNNCRTQNLYRKITLHRQSNFSIKLCVPIITYILQRAEILVQILLTQSVS